MQVWNFWSISEYCCVWGKLGFGEASGEKLADENLKTWILPPSYFYFISTESPPWGQRGLHWMPSCHISSFLSSSLLLICKAALSLWWGDPLLCTLDKKSFAIASNFVFIRWSILVSRISKKWMDAKDKGLYRLRLSQWELTPYSYFGALYLSGVGVIPTIEGFPSHLIKVVGHGYKEKTCRAWLQSPSLYKVVFRRDPIAFLRIQDNLTTKFNSITYYIDLTHVLSLTGEMQVMWVCSTYIFFISYVLMPCLYLVLI